MKAEPYAQSFNVHRSTLEQGGPLPSAETAAIEATADALDARLEFLAREPDSANRALAIADARRNAIEALEALKFGANAKFDPLIAAAREKLMAPPPIDAPHSRAVMISHIWMQVRSTDLDPLQISLLWDQMSPEYQDALLAAPAVIQKDARGAHHLVELVRPDFREQVMRSRRPQEAANLDGLHRAKEAVSLMAGFLSQAIQSRD